MMARMNAEVRNVSVLPLKVHLNECTKNRQAATTMPVLISTAKKPAERLACARGISDSDVLAIKSGLTLTQLSPDSLM